MDKKDSKYAVYEGRNPGVYDSWPEAKKQVDKYPGNCYEKLDPGTGEAPSKPYVVHQGRNPGVYDSWSGTHKQVVGYPGASYGKAKSFDDAHERFARDKQVSKEEEVDSGVSEEDSDEIGDKDEHTNGDEDSDENEDFNEEDEVDDDVEDFSDGNDDGYSGDDFDDCDDDDDDEY